MNQNGRKRLLEIRPADNVTYRAKLNILLFFVSVAFAALFGRLFYLQVLQGERFKSLAINNKQHIIRIPAYRGEVFVNDGELKIAANQASYSFFIVPNQFPHPKREKEKYEKTILQIEEKFGIPTNQTKAVVKKGRWNPYKNYLLKQDVGFNDVVKLAENMDYFPGLQYQQVPKRHYFQGTKYAHIIGFIRDITARELRNKYHQGYHRDSRIGGNGIEKQYDLELRGRDGFRIQTVDAKNKVKDEYQPPEGASTPGHNIVLTIDHNIQSIVYDMMQKYTGGCVVTRAATGEILAIYSYPSYDPNIFIGSLDVEKFRRYREDPDKPFINRVIQGLYPPSSIFKVVVSAAALRNNIPFYNARHVCEGGLQIGPQYFKCEGWHGNQSMLPALVNSCNSYYYSVGIDIGAGKIVSMARDYFNLGKRTGIDLPFEQQGRIPTEQWKLEKRGSFWWDGDTANLSIGQGFVSTTVIQLNTVIAAIANGGIAYRPHLLKKIVDIDKGETLFTADKTLIANLALDEKNIRRIQQALRQVTIWGTASKGADSKIAIAGKTGTAQNIQGKSHSWFSCYAPFKTDRLEEKIAVTVFIENGGPGGAVAAPFAAAIIESIYYGNNVRFNYKKLMQPYASRKDYYEDWLKRRNEEPLPDGYFKKTGEL